MKYEVISIEVRNEISLNENEYQVDLFLKIKPNNDLVPCFDKILTVVSNNTQTGFEVDEQRTNEINLYLSEINK